MCLNIASGEPGYGDPMGYGLRFGVRAWPRLEDVEPSHGFRHPCSPPAGEGGRLRALRSGADTGINGHAPDTIILGAPAKPSRLRTALGVAIPTASCFPDGPTRAALPPSPSPSFRAKRAYSESCFK